MRAALVGGTVALVLATSAWAFYVGGRIGFESGLLAGEMRSESLHAAGAANTLRALRGDRPDDALDLLESRVDGALLYYWGVSQFRSDLSWFDPKDRLDDVHLWYARGAARYRSEFPSQHPDEDLRATVEETVASLAPHFADWESSCPDPSTEEGIPPTALLDPVP